MIYSTPKQSRKLSEISDVSLWPPSNLDLISLYYAIWGLLQNKTNATSYSNIGSLKIAIEKKQIEINKEFIFQASKSFKRRVDTIKFSKWQSYWVDLQFYVIFLFYFLFLFLKIKINLVLLFIIIQKYS